MSLLDPLIYVNLEVVLNYFDTLVAMFCRPLTRTLKRQCLVVDGWKMWWVAVEEGLLGEEGAAFFRSKLAH
jgi:hypothetical protein